MPDIATLMQFLYEGNYFGFIQAIWVLAFQSGDLFYGTVTLIGGIALYVKLNSLIVVSVIWILFGSLFIVVMPIVSGLAMLLVIFGIAGLLYQTFMSLKA